jgi:hypothetical protein
MDPSVNPLMNLPASQRFQIMVYLGTMWTVIFCVGTGAWLWFGQLVILHLLVALGLLITGLTFRSASNEQIHVRAEIRRPTAAGILNGPGPKSLESGSESKASEWPELQCGSMAIARSCCGRSPR